MSNLAISCVFDDHHTLLYSSSIRNMLMKLLPPDYYFSEEPAELTHLLPIFRWTEWGEKNQYLSIYLLCRQRVGGVKFFYEMISRWLVPGKRPNISSFFATDFKLPALCDDTFTVCEVVITLEGEKELIRHQLPILESEIRMGLISVYHANRILEIKGLSADEKTSLIQERIVSLLERRPRDFDHDIFMHMQHFLVMCSEEFKAVREHGHMSRIIWVFYLFRKALKEKIQKTPNHRFVHVKLSKTFLHLPFGLKKVLGIFIAMNLQADNELFEERHIASVLKNQFPELHVIEDSFFSRSTKEERIQLLYLEVEKDTEFSLAQMKEIQKRLPEEIRNGIEKVARPLFMPRNEEEVMRNIIILCNQLKFSRDLPQVIIAFEEQIEEELMFTVIWTRILKPTDLPLQELFGQDSSLKFVPDRIKKVGLLRKKYPKEVNVFRVRLGIHPFLRPDHSVDLFKARQAVVQELHRLLGEFRDYNGGMIAKQHEQFLVLKSLFPTLDPNEEMLLENFFHAIFPIELRSMFNPQLLKNLFNMLLEGIELNRNGGPVFLHKADALCCYVLCEGQRAQIPSSQLLTLSLQVSETLYTGYIYLEQNLVKQNKFLESLQSAEVW
jgi:hypothetical protein